MNKPLYYKIIRDYLLILLGSALTAVGVDLFLLPQKIAAGGASGVGVVLFNTFGIPVSVTVLSINSILFFIGYRMMNIPTLIKTVVGTILLSFFLEFFSGFNAITGDTLLSAAYGGVFVGIGTGLVVTCSASTGGSDFAALLLRRVFPAFSVAKLILIIDFGIVLLSGAVFTDYTLMLYAILALFVAARVADFVIDGINFSKLVLIISDQREEISSFIINHLKRGVTSFKAKGEYSGEEKSVLMSAISPNQFPALKDFIKNADKKAFIILSDARSVFGEGFNIE